MSQVTASSPASFGARFQTALLSHTTLGRTIVILASALAMYGAQLTSAATVYPEEAVKAVFLYRFAGYVTWPESASNAPQFTIAVLGAENVAEQLKQYLPEHPIQGRPVRVTSIQRLEQLDAAQVLYIGPAAAARLSTLLESLKDRPILIVTDQPGALEVGSTVNFLMEQQHVRFEISIAAAKRAGLQIGSGLLAVAERVKTGQVPQRPTCRQFSEDISPCPLILATYIHNRRHRERG